MTNSRESLNRKDRTIIINNIIMYSLCFSFFFFIFIFSVLPVSVALAATFACDGSNSLHLYDRKFNEPLYIGQSGTTISNCNITLEKIEADLIEFVTLDKCNVTIIGAKLLGLRNGRHLSGRRWASMIKFAGSVTLGTLHVEDIECEGLNTQLTPVANQNVESAYCIDISSPTVTVTGSSPTIFRNVRLTHGTDGSLALRRTALLSLGGSSISSEFSPWIVEDMILEMSLRYHTPPSGATSMFISGVRVDDENSVFLFESILVRNLRMILRDTTTSSTFKFYLRAMDLSGQTLTVVDDLVIENTHLDMSNIGAARGLYPFLLRTYITNVAMRDVAMRSNSITMLRVRATEIDTRFLTPSKGSLAIRNMTLVGNQIRGNDLAAQLSMYVYALDAGGSRFSAAGTALEFRGNSVDLTDAAVGSLSAPHSGAHFRVIMAVHSGTNAVAGVPLLRLIIADCRVSLIRPGLILGSSGFSTFFVGLLLSSFGSAYGSQKRLSAADVDLSDSSIIIRGGGPSAPVVRESGATVDLAFIVSALLGYVNNVDVSTLSFSNVTIDMSALSFSAGTMRGVAAGSHLLVSLFNDAVPQTGMYPKISNKFIISRCNVSVSGVRSTNAAVFGAPVDQLGVYLSNMCALSPSPELAPLSISTTGSDISLQDAHAESLTVVTAYSVLATCLATNQHASMSAAFTMRDVRVHVSNAELATKSGVPVGVSAVRFMDIQHSGVSSLSLSAVTVDVFNVSSVVSTTFALVQISQVDHHHRAVGVLTRLSISDARAVYRAVSAPVFQSFVLLIASLSFGSAYAVALPSWESDAAFSLQNCSSLLEDLTVGDLLYVLVNLVAGSTVGVNQSEAAAAAGRFSIRDNIISSRNVRTHRSAIVFLLHFEDNNNGVAQIEFQHVDIIGNDVEVDASVAEMTPEDAYFGGAQLRLGGPNVSLTVSRMKMSVRNALAFGVTRQHFQLVRFLWADELSSVRLEHLEVRITSSSRVGLVYGFTNSGGAGFLQQQQSASAGPRFVARNISMVVSESQLVGASVFVLVLTQFEAGNSSSSSDSSSSSPVHILIQDCSASVVNGEVAAAANSDIAHRLSILYVNVFPLPMLLREPLPLQIRVESSELLFRGIQTSPSSSRQGAIFVLLAWGSDSVNVSTRTSSANLSFVLSACSVEIHDIAFRGPPPSTTRLLSRLFYSFATNHTSITLIDSNLTMRNCSAAPGGGSPPSRVGASGVELGDVNSAAVSLSRVQVSMSGIDAVVNVAATLVYDTAASTAANEGSMPSGITVGWCSIHVSDVIAGGYNNEDVQLISVSAVELQRSLLVLGITVVSDTVLTVTGIVRRATTVASARVTIAVVWTDWGTVLRGETGKMAVQRCIVFVGGEGTAPTAAAVGQFRYSIVSAVLIRASIALGQLDISVRDTELIVAGSSLSSSSSPFTGAFFAYFVNAVRAGVRSCVVDSSSLTIRSFFRTSGMCWATAVWMSVPPSVSTSVTNVSVLDSTPQQQQPQAQMCSGGVNLGLAFLFDDLEPGRSATDDPPTSPTTSLVVQDSVLLQSNDNNNHDHDHSSSSVVQFFPSWGYPVHVHGVVRNVTTNVLLFNTFTSNVFFSGHLTFENCAVDQRSAVMGMISTEAFGRSAATLVFRNNSFFPSSSGGGNFIMVDDTLGASADFNDTEIVFDCNKWGPSVERRFMIDRRALNHFLRITRSPRCGPLSTRSRTRTKSASDAPSESAEQTQSLALSISNSSSESQIRSSSLAESLSHSSNISSVSAERTTSLSIPVPPNPSIIPGSLAGVSTTAALLAVFAGSVGAAAASSSFLSGRVLVSLRAFRSCPLKSLEELAPLSWDMNPTTLESRRAVPGRHETTEHAVSTMRGAVFGNFLLLLGATVLLLIKLVWDYSRWKPASSSAPRHRRVHSRRTLEQRQELAARMKKKEEKEAVNNSSSKMKQQKAAAAAASSSQSRHGGKKENRKQKKSSSSSSSSPRPPSKWAAVAAKGGWPGNAIIFLLVLASLASYAVGTLFLLPAEMAWAIVGAVLWLAGPAAVLVWMVAAKVAPREAIVPLRPKRALSAKEEAARSDVVKLLEYLNENVGFEWSTKSPTLGLFASVFDSYKELPWLLLDVGLQLGASVACGVAAACTTSVCCRTTSIIVAVLSLAHTLLLFVYFGISVFLCRVDRLACGGQSIIVLVCSALCVTGVFSSFDALGELLMVFAFVGLSLCLVANVLALSPVVANAARSVEKWWKRACDGGGGAAAEKKNHHGRGSARQSSSRHHSSNSSRRVNISSWENDDDGEGHQLVFMTPDEMWGPEESPAAASAAAVAKSSGDADESAMALLNPRRAAIAAAQPSHSPRDQHHDDEQDEEEFEEDEEDESDDCDDERALLDDGAAVEMEEMTGEELRKFLSFKENARV